MSGERAGRHGIPVGASFAAGAVRCCPNCGRWYEVRRLAQGSGRRGASRRWPLVCWRCEQPVEMRTERGWP